MLCDELNVALNGGWWAGGLAGVIWDRVSMMFFSFVF